MTAPDPAGRPGHQPGPPALADLRDTRSRHRCSGRAPGRRGPARDRGSPGPAWKSRPSIAFRCLPPASRAPDSAGSDPIRAPAPFPDPAAIGRFRTISGPSGPRNGPYGPARDRRTGPDPARSTLWAVTTLKNKGMPRTKAQRPRSPRLSGAITGRPGACQDPLKTAGSAFARVRKTKGQSVHPRDAQGTVPDLPAPANRGRTARQASTPYRPGMGSELSQMGSLQGACLAP